MPVYGLLKLAVHVWRSQAATFNNCLLKTLRTQHFVQEEQFSDDCIVFSAPRLTIEGFFYFWKALYWTSDMQLGNTCVWERNLQYLVEVKFTFYHGHQAEKSAQVFGPVVISIFDSFYPKSTLKARFAYVFFYKRQLALFNESRNSSIITR